MLRRADPSPDIAHTEIASAGRYLADARKCLQEKMPEMAVVAVYTAMFHSARAILFRDGIRERSHVCVVAYLAENYPLLREHINALDMFRRSRHNMLYGVDVTAVEEDARQGIDAARRFLEASDGEIRKPAPPGRK